METVLKKQYRRAANSGWDKVAFQVDPSEANEQLKSGLWFARGLFDNAVINNPHSVRCKMRTPKIKHESGDVLCIDFAVVQAKLVRIADNNVLCGQFIIEIERSNRRDYVLKVVLIGQMHGMPTVTGFWPTPSKPAPKSHPSRCIHDFDIRTLVCIHCNIHIEDVPLWPDTIVNRLLIRMER